MGFDSATPYDTWSAMLLETEGQWERVQHVEALEREFWREALTAMRT